MNIRPWLLLPGAALAFVLIAAAPPPASKNALESLSPEDRQKAQAQMEAYRKTEFDPGERKYVIKDVLKLPRAAQEVFLSVVEEDMKKAHAAYRQEFKKTSDSIMQHRESKATRDEIKKLRESVTALTKMGDNLPKEKIVEIGDPAVKRLREIFTFTREAVIKAGISLDTNRERLVALIESRQHLRKSLEIKDGKDFTPDSLKEEEKAIAEKAPPYEKEAVKIMEANQKLGTAANVPVEEIKGVQATNELRALLGLSALVIDPKLCDAARGHSKDMVEKNFFAHESPVPGKKSPWDRAKLAGTSAGAENIFAGSPDPNAAVMAWFHSPGHHVNMLNPGHRRMAMGRHNGHWTQMFGG
jgi:uncharacterized protein YkwD